MNHRLPTSPAPSAEPAAGKVLAVDDEAISRRLLELHLRRLGYTPVMAGSVAEARQILTPEARPSFLCVLTDFRMPGESGMELLAWLQREDPTLACVLLTATTDRQIVLDALRSGACDFIEKPFRQDELAASLGKAGEATRLRRHNVATEADALSVGQLQQRLLKAGSGTLTNGITYCHHPRHEAGGDFLNVVPLDDGNLMVLVADVSGHDLRAAFVSTYFQGIARGMLQCKADVRQVLRFFNHYLVSEWNTVSDTGHQTTSIAVCAIVLDRAERQVTVFNAGAPAPRCFGGGRPSAFRAEGGGHPLGWFDPMELQPVEAELEPGSHLLLWTDGLEDHAEQLNVSPFALAYRLLQPGKSGGHDCDLDTAKDDILALRVGVMPRQAPAFHTLLHEFYRGSQADEIDRLQERWERTLELALPSCPQETMDIVLLCLREACLNGMNHGCGRRDDLSVELFLAYEAAAQRLHAVISDPGPGHCFDWQQHVAEALDSLIAEHRGLSLIFGLPTSAVAEANGSRLVLAFDLKPPVSQPTLP